MSRLVKLVGTGIGLAREAMEARKSSAAAESSTHQSYNSNAEANSSNPPEYVELPRERADELIARGQAVPAEKSSLSPNPDDEDSSPDEDEEDWLLDEAAEAADPPSYEESEQQVSMDEMVNSVMHDFHPPPTISRLPCPVIIPQRRPRSKARGFVRAYAPVLNDCGIDQETFLKFLKSFHQSSKASPVLDVIFIGAGIAGLAPSVIAMATSIAVQVAVGTAKEVQSRYRANAFLARMNEELFKPRGLFAMVMSFKPDSSKALSSERIDISQTIAKYDQSSGSKFKDGLTKLRVSSGTSHSEFEMPEAAPLVYPALDAAAAATDKEGQNKFKRAQKFVADYMDRRAQASYAYENSNSSLAAPPTKFASRYSDPNHTANNGSLISLLTGGAINPHDRRQHRRALRDVRRAERRPDRYERRPDRYERRVPRQGGRRSRGGGPIRRMMQQDVLYLMIVNLPTEEETAQARAVFNQAERG